MKLYDVTQAPNPRRVRIFIAEKAIDVEMVPVDMMGGAHKQPDYLQKHPSGKLPVLETDDGQFIGETVAICRYLEALHPEPNLFGATPYELGRVEMFNRILEFELWREIGTSWVNGPIVAKVAAGRFKQLPEAKALSDAATHRFYKRLDRELAERDWMAGDRYTIADITALTAIDFATAMVDLRPAAELERLWAWHEKVTARPSSGA